MENYVITIARGYGSDGCAIAKRLAEQLGIHYLDRELLTLASIESGISEELFENADEKVNFGLLESKWDRKYDLEFDSVDPYQKTSEYNLFRYQAETIKNLARKQSFVVIGRAADYILQQHRYVLSVNIQAPFEDCVKAIMDRKYVDMKTAIKDIRRIDKERDTFYKTYTGREWSDILNYDLCINSVGFSEQGCVDLIRKAACKKFHFEV